MSDANPSTIREKLRASVYAHLDASDLNALVDQWVASTKAATTAAGNADPSYPDKWLNWMIDSCAADIACGLPPDSQERVSLLVLSGPFENGDQLTGFQGEPGEVLVSPTGDADDYVPAEARPRQAVRWKRRNYTTLSAIGDEYYYIDPSYQIWFTGDPAASRAKVWLVIYDVNWAAPDPDPLLRFPDSNYRALEMHVLASIFAQHGARLEAAAYFARERDKEFATLGIVGPQAGAA